MARIRCLAQLVNVIAPIMTEAGGGAWRQASYHPFALTSRYGRGMVLQLPLQSPVYETGAFGDVPVLDAVAVASDEGGVTLFAVNRDQTTLVVLDGCAVAAVSVRRLSRGDLGRRSGRGEHAVVAGPRGPEDAGRPETRRRSPAGRAAAAVLEHDPAELATAVPGRRCMSF
jgi:Alpha-L-arabinofuranosidase C-terminal domain